MNNRPIYKTRQEVAKILTDLGFPISENTLATMGSRGGGPPFSKFGRRVIYDLTEVLSWARARIIPSKRQVSPIEDNAALILTEADNIDI